MTVQRGLRARECRDALLVCLTVGGGVLEHACQQRLWPRATRWGRLKCRKMMEEA